MYLSAYVCVRATGALVMTESVGNLEKYGMLYKVFTSNKVWGVLFLPATITEELVRNGRDFNLDAAMDVPVRWWSVLAPGNAPGFVVSIATPLHRHWPKSGDHT